MKKRPAFRSFLADRQGLGTIEFVATLPMFLAALAFAFEFGMLFLAHQSVTNNVRAATRFLSRVPAPYSSENRAIAVNLIRTGQPFGGTPPSFLAGVCTPSSSCMASTNIGGNTRVTISVHIDYPLTIFNFAERSGDPFNDAPGPNRATIPFVVRESAEAIGL
jgi:Flp pilus assembly protein TadG